MKNLSPLRAEPDYGENPHDGSDPSGWLKYSANDLDTSIQPEEDAFFGELVGAVKKAFTSSFLDPTAEGAASPSILPHEWADPSDSGKQRMNQDLAGPSQGLGANVIHSGGAFDNLANDINKAVDQTQQAAQKIQQVQQQEKTPASTSTTPAPTTPQVNTPQTTAPAPTTPAPAVKSMTPVAPPTPPPGPKPTSVTYSTKTSSIEFDPDAFSAKSLSERAHNAFFQSNPFMTWNQSVEAPGAQYNDMNYNPRPSYFEEGTGDSSFSNLHNKNNGNYSRDTLNFGGVTDMLIVRPADPRWTNEPVDLGDTLPMTLEASADPIKSTIDVAIMRNAKRLSTEDNPYIRDYSEVRPLNADMDFSVNKPEVDPNDPQDPSENTLHQQPSPRFRAIGPQSLMEQFDPNQQTADPFIETVSPGSADGTRFSIPSYKTRKPTSDLRTIDFIKDH